MAIRLLDKLIYTEITGAELKVLIGNSPRSPGKHVFKVLNKGNGFIHYTHQYKEGKNVDSIKFNPTGSCQGGGMYFVTLDNIQEFLSFGDHLAVIEVYDNSRVYVEKNKFKANKFNIVKIIPFDEVAQYSEEIATQILIPAVGEAYNPDQIVQTEELCLDAVNADGSLICFVHPRFRTEALCITAVNQDGGALRFIRNQTEEICLAAVKKHGLALEYVDKKLVTFDLIKAAVEENGGAIKFVKPELQTYELCLDAVKRCTDEDWDEQVISYIRPDLWTKELCIEAVKRDPFSLECIRGELHTKEVCSAAVRAYGWSIKFVDRALITPRMVAIATSSCADAIALITNPTEEMIKAAVEKNSLALEYVKHQTEQLCIDAVLKNRNAAQFVFPQFAEAVQRATGVAIEARFGANEGAMVMSSSESDD